MNRQEFRRKYTVNKLNQNTTAIIACHDDNDGAASARIAYKHLIECGYDDNCIWPLAISSLKNAARSIAGAVSACENLKKVIIVDIAIQYIDDFAILDEIASLPEVSVDYIDHHLSTVKCLNAYDLRSSRNFHTHVDVEHSATYLTWDLYFMTSMPAVYKLVDDHDLYKNEYENSNAFYKGSLKYNLNKIKSPCGWDSLENDEKFLQRIIDEGKIIVWYEENIVYPHIMKNSRRFVLTLRSKTTKSGCHFGNCIVVNTSVGNCELFKINNSEYDFAIKECINYRGEWVYTVYSNKYDATIIAEQFGGGGHSGVAGFTSPEQIFKGNEGMVNISIDSDKFGEIFMAAPVKF